MSKTKKKARTHRLLSSDEPLIVVVDPQTKQSYTFSLANPIATSYSILGLPKAASFAEVQQAYKDKLYQHKLLMEHYDELEPGSSKAIRFMDVMEAFKNAYCTICEFLQQDPQLNDLEQLAHAESQAV